MAILYIAAGIMHFIRPETYETIMPDYLPWHSALIFLSGVFEIIAGLLLISERTKHIGAWMVIILLIGVFPANIQMSVNYYRHNLPGFWLTILRLPFQFLLIWWAWIYTRKPDLR